MKGLPATNRWREAVRASPARRVAVFLDDRASFTEALCALWAEGKQAVLPGDVLPATVSALSSVVDGFLGEFPGVQSLVAGPAVPWDGPRDFDREAQGIAVFTSGSTGAPSVIPKRLRQLFDEVETLERTFGPSLSREADFISTVSHQHIYGLLFAVLWPLVTGRKPTARRLEYPEQMELELARPSVLISSPAHLKRLTGGRRWDTKVQAVFSSGGPLPAEASTLALEVLGQRPREVFGSSETGGIAWRSGPDEAWVPLSGVEVSLEGGVLRVKSRHLERDEWFETADRVEGTSASFRLLGRADRIAKIEEKRVSLELIEKTAVGTGLVSAARVVPLEGVRTTLGLVAIATPAGEALGRKGVAEKLRAAIAEAVELVAVPRRFRLVKTLPMDDQGKVTVPRLRMLFGPERPTIDWKERAAEHVVGTFTVTPELRVLDGHFPGTPIVPGVAQLDWAISFGREHFPAMGRKLARVEVLKFQKLMVPGHQVQLTLDWNPAKHTLTFKFVTAPGAKTEGTYSGARVVFQP
ncbi:MAG: AMP-binding protein [Myxococcaceae bacterium]